jgi:hypothetical protein
VTVTEPETVLGKGHSPAVDGESCDAAGEVLFILSFTTGLVAGIHHDRVARGSK